VASGKIKTIISDEDFILEPGGTCLQPPRIVEALKDSTIVEIKSPTPDIGKFFDCCKVILRHAQDEDRNSKNALPDTQSIIQNYGLSPLINEAAACRHSGSISRYPLCRLRNDRVLFEQIAQ
jgi:hypothetical protein